ncbi:nucleoside hydrolase [[Clostridium] fimetarium]|uniref:Inosine-uridine preferring nucleoside hydrolase n=1 Tax=[Clostridium] fimetarium TaxID=99656 RepID=A0A1I0NE50_9FIRM|nr:nucleoside hydrolase [[Clostridium] fimetarium]SEV99382.1 Inosine-uridine preferring nucleoside hydrolase [[Clostridium] fimetarium]
MLKEKPVPFPFEKAIRVIVDTDCNCECDDQFAVAHFLMTPKFDMKGFIAEHYGEEDSEQMSYDEIVKVTELMGLGGEVNILHGAAKAMIDEHTPIDSEGARFIIEEAMKDDPRPLYVCNQGAVTNIASAFLLEPKIADRLTVVWIGGGAYPHGGTEFNMKNDLNAARVVFKSNLRLWQIPANVYSTMAISFMELLTRIYPCGEIGKYLYENTMIKGKIIMGKIRKTVSVIAERAKKENNQDMLQAFLGGDALDMDLALSTESWLLGDSPCAGLLHNPKAGKYHMAEAPCDLFDDGKYDMSKPGSKRIRIYDEVDVRFILDDMCNKFKFYFGD